MVQVRYFAAAQEFAGHSSEERSEETVGQLRSALAASYPALGGILPKCAVLVNGARVADETTLSATDQVDVLPPFAGG